MSVKTLIATSVVAIALATTAMADSNFTGAYVGGNFGHGTGEVTSADNVPALSGVVGGIHGGYQHQLGMFGVGAEGSFNLGNAENKTVTAQGKFTLKRKHAFGVAARLGVAINSWMAYTKLGWENAQFAIKTIDGTAKNQYNAFVAGLGFETVVANNIMVGGEWTTSFYKKDKSKLRISDFKVRLGYKF